MPSDYAGGDAAGLAMVLPSLVVQGLLTMSDTIEESLDAAGWDARIQAACRMAGG